MFFIILLLLSPTISAIAINFDSPSSVEINEEFTVTIDADSQETHDVKIFVHTSEDKKIARGEYISEIYEEDWADSWFYIKESFPEKVEYKIKVIESPGERKICVRLRKTSTQTTKIECKDLSVLESEQVQEAPSFEETPAQPDDEEKKETQVKSEPKTQKLSIETNEKILLNSPDSDPPVEVITKKEKTRQGILYSFIFLTIAIVILLALRRL